jgi:lysozyme
MSGHEKLWSEKEIDQMVAAAVARPKGIDVSNWQSAIDWKQVKDAGYQFVFMKATEGNDFIDHTFDEFRQGARDAGLKVGYYHFYQPSVPVDEQVNLFCSVVGKAEPDALRLVIDAEDNSIWEKYPVQERARMVDEFLTGVQNKLGITPQVCIYCSKEFANDMLGNAPELKKYSLWIANWGPHDPPVPEPWDNWDFWQYTDIGNVPGIKDKVDLDVFNGTDINQSVARSTAGLKTR